MKLSKRGEYSLRAMIHLASQTSGFSIVRVKDIAEAEDIPVKFLERILHTMKNAGLLRSKVGVGGGYYLAKPPSEIILGDIIRVIDGPLAPISCVSQTAYEPCGCRDEETCGLRLVMLDVRNAIAAILDNTTLEDVTRRVQEARDNVITLNERRSTMSTKDKILVIDDDPDFLDFVRMVLESENYEVHTADNASAGLALMRQIHPDLVLLDLMISYVLDGLNVTRKMQKDPRLSKIPLIMISAIVTRKDEKMLPEDMDISDIPLLSKPIEPTELLRQVKKHIRD